MQIEKTNGTVKLENRFTELQKKYETSNRNVRFNVERDQNSGGLFGGLGYTAGKMGTGLAGVFEGIGKGVEGLGALFSGDKEYAKYVFSNSEVDKWRKQLDDWYNPGTVMSFVGDAAEGVGQSSVFLLNAIPGLGQAGTAAFFVGAAGNGISSAVQKTGELGAKEIAYGVLSSAAEAALEQVSGGGARMAKNIAGKVAVGAGKRAVSNIAATAAKQAVWKTVGKEILSSAAGEFVEEFLGELVDVGLQRMTGVDKNASTSVGQALYAGLVGFASGGVMGGFSSAVSQSSNVRRGRRVIDAGNADATVGVAEEFRKQYSAANNKLIKAVNSELKTSIDAWNKITDKSSVNAARVMGEIQMTLANLNVIEAVQDKAAEIRRLVAEDPSKAEIFANYINTISQVKEEGQKVRAEDFFKEDSYAIQLMSVLGFAGDAMTNSEAQVRESLIRSAMNGEDISQSKLNVKRNKKTGAVEPIVKYIYANASTVFDANATDTVYDNGTGQKIAVHKNQDGTYNISIGENVDTAKTYLNQTQERVTAWVSDFGKYGEEYQRNLYANAAQQSGMPGQSGVTAVQNPGKIGTEDMTVWGTDGKVMAEQGKKAASAENGNAVSAGDVAGAQKTSPDAKNDSDGKTVRKGENKANGKQNGATEQKKGDSGDGKSKIEHLREGMTSEEKTRAEKNSGEMRRLRLGSNALRQQIREIEKSSAQSMEMTEKEKQTKLNSLKKKLEQNTARYDTLLRDNERIRKRVETGKEQEAPKPKTEQAKEEGKADFEEAYSSGEEARSDPENTADERFEKIPDADWRDGQKYVKNFDLLSYDRKRAVCATVHSAKVSGVTSKPVISAAAKLASMRSGLEIRFSDKIAASSWFRIDAEKGERMILIDTKEGDASALRNALAHEMVHDLRYTNESAYEKIRNTAMEMTDDERYYKVMDQYTKHFNGKSLSEYLKENKLERSDGNIDTYFEEYKKISRDYAEEEVVAKCLMNESRVQRLYDRLGDRSRWQRFLDAAKDFKEAIHSRIKGDTDEASELMRKQSEAIERYIRKALVADAAAEKVMRRYGYDGKEAYGEEKTDDIEFVRIKRNIKKSFEEYVKEIENISDEDAKRMKSEDVYVTVMEDTPDILQEYGAGNHPIIMRFDSMYLSQRSDGTLFDKSSAHYHGLGRSILRLKEIIKDPDVILNNPDNGRIMLLSSIQTKKGQAIASIEFNTVKDINNGYTLTNLVVTFFDYKQNYLKNLKEKYHYNPLYQKESLAQVNPQLHKWMGIFNANDSMNSISQNSGKSTDSEQENSVNQKNNLKEQSEEDQEYSEYNKPITEKDVEVLRRIGRKSVNDFSPGDLKSAQKWAYKFYKELGVKSPFFRAWFGDWRAKDASSVNVTTIPEYTASNEARKQNRGIAKNADTGWDIRISRNGETNTISHSGGERMSEYGLAGIRQLVENAVLLDSEVHEHHSNNAANDLISFDHKLYALGENNEGIGLYKITVEEYFQSQKQPGDKRFHNLKYIEKVAEVSADALAERNRSGGSTMRSSTTTYSISDLYDFVKRYDKEFSVGKSVSHLLLNEDGTPKMVYHGTDAEFTVFDRTKGRSTMDIQGMFFSPLEIDARDYGGSVGTYYINLRNPASEAVAYKALNLFKGQNDAGAKAREYLIQHGYDGVNNSDEEYIAFYPEQIKSVTDNIGTFDGTNPDIRYNLPEDAESKKDAEIRKIEKEADKKIKKAEKKAQKAEEKAKESVNKAKEKTKEEKEKRKEAVKQLKQERKERRESEREDVRRANAGANCVKAMDEMRETVKAMRGNTQIVRDEFEQSVIKLAGKMRKDFKNPFSDSATEVFDLFAKVDQYLVNEDEENPGLMSDSNKSGWSFSDRFSPRAKQLIKGLAEQAGGRAGAV